MRLYQALRWLAAVLALGYLIGGLRGVLVALVAHEALQWIARLVADRR